MVESKPIAALLIRKLFADERGDVSELEERKPYILIFGLEADLKTIWRGQKLQGQINHFEAKVISLWLSF